ncbi:hypothetical protein COJ96_07645 [Bacillus sp. AFS073361]|nr:hypothetical protein COJ96_07645 [Bacillus sp. AFS073361]
MFWFISPNWTGISPTHQFISPNLIWNHSNSVQDHYTRWDFADFLFFYTELGWDFADVLIYFAKLDWNLANSLTYFAKRNHNFAETPIYSANHHFKHKKRAAIRRSFPKLLCRC